MTTKGNVYDEEYYRIGFLRYRVNVYRNDECVKTGDIFGTRKKAKRVAIHRMAELIRSDIRR